MAFSPLLLVLRLQLRGVFVAPLPLTIPFLPASSAASTSSSILPSMPPTPPATTSTSMRRAAVVVVVGVVVFILVHLLHQFSLVLHILIP